MAQLVEQFLSTPEISEILFDVNSFTSCSEKTVIRI